MVETGCLSRRLGAPPYWSRRRALHRTEQVCRQHFPASSHLLLPLPLLLLLLLMRRKVHWCFATAPASGQPGRQCCAPPRASAALPWDRAGSQMPLQGRRWAEPHQPAEPSGGLPCRQLCAQQHPPAQGWPSPLARRAAARQGSRWPQRCSAGCGPGGSAGWGPAPGCTGPSEPRRRGSPCRGGPAQTPWTQQPWST
jgi:hypothetical protein